MEDLSRCVHCGMCLSSCPTYLETGLETEGPRGRIALMRAVQEEAIELNDRVVGHLEACVQCRACEDVCPSGVPFGRMMEAQRQGNRARGRDPLRLRIFDTVVYRWLLPSKRALRVAGRVGAIAGKLGLLALVRRLRLLGRTTDFLPALDPGYLDDAYPAQGPQRGTLAVLEGCIMPLTLANVNQATVRVCTALGYRVVNPASQVCCGALHAHRGYLDQARVLARRNIAAYLACGADQIVINSAGCGAMLKEYGELLHDDPEWAERAAIFSQRVVDIAELLASEPPLATGTLACRVTYQESCHLGHAQRIKQEPRNLLRGVPGVDFVEMREADLCCGSGGVYTILQPDMSNTLLDRTMVNVAAVAPDLLVTANPGCIMQLQAGARRAGLALPVKHLVEVIDEAMRANARELAESPPPRR